jgi:hypothetical protein
MAMDRTSSRLIYEADLIKSKKILDTRRQPRPCGLLREIPKESQHDATAAAEAERLAVLSTEA